MGDINRVKSSYLRYILSCESGDEFKLTRKSECTPFALCFALCGLHLIAETDYLQSKKDIWTELIVSNVCEYKKYRESESELAFDKPFLQLLVFSLSVLSIFDRHHDDSLCPIIEEVVVKDVGRYLNKTGALDGRPQSGNLAMFAAILLIHARDHMGLDANHLLQDWVDLHLESMNRFGFWGQDRRMTYLQFQNGYHQYEILDYLEVDDPKAEVAANRVEEMADRDGHFAPYPGGGGCYDYDAISTLTARGVECSHERRQLLKRTFKSISESQNPDGGFAESCFIRPRTLRNMLSNIQHVIQSNGFLRRERLRGIVSTQRPKHDRIHTHWSEYSREWGESDLWDSWFRVMALARIQIVLEPGTEQDWGFINYPGIGYHHSLAARAS